MQEIGEQLDGAILAYAILLQLMHCSITSCVLHIAYCISHVACCIGVRSPLELNDFTFIKNMGYSASEEASDVYTHAFLCSSEACVIMQVVAQVTHALLELNEGDKRKVKMHKCGQILLVFEACIRDTCFDES